MGQGYGQQIADSRALWSDLVPIDPANIIATAVGALFVGVLGYLFKLAGRGHDSRAAAEAALIGISPPIIVALNDRVEQLENRNSELWKEIGRQADLNRGCEQRCTEMGEQLYATKRELYDTKRDLAAAKQRISVLEQNGNGHR